MVIITGRNLGYAPEQAGEDPPKPLARDRHVYPNQNDSLELRLITDPLETE